MSTRVAPKAKIDVPFILTEAVRSGRAIIFLGAGASKECLNIAGKRPPNANELRDILSTRFFGKLMPTRNVMTVAEMAIESGAGSSLVYQAVSEAFDGFETSEAHRKLSDFNWKTIATTNYDLFLEAAYSNSTRRRQTLIPFVKDDEPVEERMRAAENPLQYLKLHGCLNHRFDTDIPLILSWDQYAKYSENRIRLFSRLTYLAPEAPIIFIGYGLGDSHIRDLLYKLETAKRPRWYIVDPDAEQEDIDFYGTKNIGVFPCRFGEFMDALDEAIPKLLRFLTPSPESIEFPMARFFAPGLTASSAVEKSLISDLTFVHSGMSSAEQTPKQFYSGYDTGWGAIVGRLDARRKVVDDLLFKALLANEASEGPHFFVLRGPAGAGKTIALKRAAFDAATASNELVLWLEESGQLRPDVFYEIHDLTQRPIYLFIDEVAVHAQKLVPFISSMKHRKIPIIIIGAEREADWASYCQGLNDDLVPTFLRVGNLSTSEVDTLLDLLKRHGCLGELAGKSREQQVDAFMAEHNADRQLLVALHVLTKGMPFEEIVFKEYSTVTPDKARRLYLDIATMNQFGVSVRAGTISRSSGIDFLDYQAEFFEPLKDMVSLGKDRYTQDVIYKTRHPRVAQILFRMVCSTDEVKAAQFIRLIRGFDVGYESDSRALEGICRGRSLVESFGDAALVRSIYEAATSAAPAQAYLFQQWAIFESSHPKGDFDLAEALAEKAVQKDKAKNKSFIHTQAEVARKRANNVDSPILKDRLRRQTRRFLDMMPRADRFTTSSRCKLLVDEVTDLSRMLTEHERASDDNIFSEKLSDAEAALLRAQQDYPDDAEMVETEARLLKDIDKDRALKALERAWRKSPRGTGTAVRLAKIYGAAGRGVEQLKVLTEALARDPDDKASHLALAHYLLEQEAPNMSDIERHLAASFSGEDQNYEARYVLAQFYF